MTQYSVDGLKFDRRVLGACLKKKTKINNTSIIGTNATVIITSCKRTMVCGRYTTTNIGNSIFFQRIETTATYPYYVVQAANWGICRENRNMHIHFNHRGVNYDARIIRMVCLYIYIYVQLLTREQMFESFFFCIILYTQWINIYV